MGCSKSLKEYKMKKNKVIAIGLFLLINLFVLACSSDDDSISSTNLQMNECLGAEVPFPSSASINACVNIDQSKSVIFNPNITWQESINFFSSNYNSGNWTITNHEIFEYDTPGEKEAEWSIIGQEFTVEIRLTGFGNDSSGFITGSYIIYY